MDHAKAREVLKIAKEKAQKKQSDTSMSRIVHSEVTHRYQNPRSGSLSPQVHLKPQRYRNEENDSSLKKTGENSEWQDGTLASVSLHLYPLSM